MAEQDQGERTEEATQQRREEFRNRGQVAQTKELGTVLLLFASVLAVWLMGRYAFQQIYEVFRGSFVDFVLASGAKGDYLAAAQFAGSKMLWICMPISALLWLVAFSASILQVGFLYNEEALDFNLDRLNPVSGFQRMFNFRSLIEGAKSLLKLLAIGVIVWFVVRNQVLTIPRLIYYGPGELFNYIYEVIFRMVSGIGFFMGVLAGADYFFQRWDLEQKMKMTKQEVKEEMKSREGDPLIRARIRRVQREMANRRMMSDVPKADVIVTNPTHLACALKYDDKMIAPKLVAKGAGVVAEKIRALAKEHNIPIVENKPLARTIFKTLKIGQIIPRELYTAVAEVLSYVYKLKRKGRR